MFDRLVSPVFTRVLPGNTHPCLHPPSPPPPPVFNLDVGQLKLVYEALQERKSLLDNAPHLTSTLPIIMPCYKWWEVPFYWAGLKTYDVIAGVLLTWRGCT